jgi:probable F420-dependent oxidoreductase
MRNLSKRSIELAPPGRTMAEHVEIAQLAAANGWGGVWISELAGFDGVTQAIATGQAIAPGRAGTAILPMQTRDPMLMAMTAASINQLLGGRFVLGLGTSTQVIIEGWHATDWGKPLSLTREYVSLVRRFLAGERVTTDQGRYHYRGASLGNQLPSEIPIYLAGLNDKMLELVGEVADGALLNFASLDYVRHVREHLAIGRKRAGKTMDDFEIVVFFRCSLTDDYEEVRGRYQREFLTYVMAPVYQRMWSREGLGPMCANVEQLWRQGQREDALAAISDELAQQRALIGTAEEVQSRLDGYFEAGMHTAIVMPIARPGADYLQDCRDIVSGLVSERQPT